VRGVLTTCALSFLLSSRAVPPPSLLLQGVKVAGSIERAARKDDK
jgi:hypothetical protein